MVKSSNPEYRPRAVDLNLNLGILERGAQNSITDVTDVRVGHTTIISGDGSLRSGQGPIRTGITTILPHTGNLYREKVPAGVHALNGFGKSIGIMQIMELGRLESPICLTNTLNVWSIADVMVDYLSELNPGVKSFNPLVLECNDGFLNDVIGKHVNSTHLMNSIDTAISPNITEGNIGAGTGMTGFGWKGGIGTSSRICESLLGIYTVGVLTLCNMGDPSDLRMGSIPVGEHLKPPGVSDETGGSICFVIATDAPVTARQLNRMAKRAPIGLARSGGIISHGSGSLALAFSTSQERPQIDDAHLASIFRGVVEATEESIINSILKAETLEGRDGNIRRAIPIEPLQNILNQYKNNISKSTGP